MNWDFISPLPPKMHLCCTNFPSNSQKQLSIIPFHNTGWYFTPRAILYSVLRKMMNHKIFISISIAIYIHKSVYNQIHISSWQMATQCSQVILQRAVTERQIQHEGNSIIQISHLVYAPNRWQQSTRNTMNLRPCLTITETRSHQNGYQWAQSNKCLCLTNFTHMSSLTQAHGTIPTSKATQGHKCLCRIKASIKKPGRGLGLFCV